MTIGELWFRLLNVPANAEVAVQFDVCDEDTYWAISRIEVTARPGEGSVVMIVVADPKEVEQIDALLSPKGGV